FATAEARKANMPELIALLDGLFARKPQKEWLRLLVDAGLLFAPIQQLADVVDDPQALSNGYMVDFEHRALGRIRVPGYPVTFGAHAAGMVSPAPELGEHTVEVLTGLGYSARDIDGLKAANVVR